MALESSYLATSILIPMPIITLWNRVVLFLKHLLFWIFLSNLTLRIYFPLILPVKNSLLATIMLDLRHALIRFGNLQVFLWTSTCPLKSGNLLHRYLIPLMDLRLIIDVLLHTILALCLWVPCPYIVSSKRAFVVRFMIMTRNRMK